jgi:hypothetical protein
MGCGGSIYTELAPLPYPFRHPQHQMIGAGEASSDSG